MLMPVDSQHITLLHWAALNDRVEVAGLLVEAGVPVDSVGGEAGQHGPPLGSSLRQPVSVGPAGVQGRQAGPA